MKLTKISRRNKVRVNIKEVNLKIMAVKRDIILNLAVKIMRIMGIIQDNKIMGRDQDTNERFN